MKKFLLCNSGQTFIEYALVLSFFIGVFTIALPPLRDATVVAINRVAEQMEPNFPGWNDGGQIIEENYFTWFPPELDMSDPNVIYAAESITMIGNATIIGNVISNGRVSVRGRSRIQGQVNDFAEYDFNFPLPVFPQWETDSVPYMGSIDLSTGTTHEVSGSGYYSNISVGGSTLVFDTGNEGDVQTIIADNMDLSNSTLRLDGEGKLVILVREGFDFSTSNWNKDGLPQNVTLYYSGSKDIKFAGNTHFCGSLYAESAGVNFAGNSQIKGNIIIGGSVVSGEAGTADLNDALLYAPEAELRLVGTASLTGRIITKSIYLQGTPTVTFKPVMLSDDFFWDMFEPQ